MAIQPIYLLSTALLSMQLIEQAADAGIVLDAAAYISTEPISDVQLQSKLRELSRQQLTAVFTSVHSVEALSGVAAKGWRIFCIGRATKKSVVEYFSEAAVAGTAESASELAEVIKHADGGRGNIEGEHGRVDGGHGDTGEIVFFCGDHRREELPSALRSAGFVVNEQIVYRTLPTPHKTVRDYAGIAFFSPSAVESFFSLNMVEESTTLFAIGRTTAAALNAQCSNPVITGDQPEKEALIRKMIDHFLNKR